MTTQEIVKDAEGKFEAAIEHTKEEFAGIRTGRANPALFSAVTASYYGTPTLISQLASFTVPENRVIIVSPFDKGAIDAIVKGLQDSDLGVNPQREGDIIRVTLPEMTKERRTEYAKLAKTRAEESKITVRSIRHKAIDGIDKLVKDKEIGEDEGKRAKEQVEKSTKDHVATIDTLLSHKEKEILEV